MSVLFDSVCIPVAYDEIDRAIVCHDGMVVVAEECHDYGSFTADFCGYSRVEYVRGEYVSTPHCKYCDDGRGDRVANALNRAIEYSPLPLSDTLQSLSCRGVDMALIGNSRGTSVGPVGGYVGRDDIIIVSEYDSGADGMAREIIALSWAVGTIPVSDVEDMSSVRVSDCEESVYGVVWGNVDNEGYSSPTESELIDYADQL